MLSIWKTKLKGENMELVEYKMSVPKEAKEVVDFMAGLIEDILAKKGIAQISAENLPALMEAVSGYEEVMGAMSSEYRDEIAGYMVKEMMAKLWPYTPELPEPAPVA
jgi:hypothetical protein